MFSDDGSDTTPEGGTDTDGTDTVSTTTGPTDTQPAGVTDTTATTAGGGSTTGQITAPPEDIVNAIEVVDAGVEISLDSIYGEENITWNDGKAELQISDLNEYSLYAIYEGSRNLKTYYDMNASERKMNISPAFINSGTIEAMMIPRSVERDGQQLVEVTLLVDGEFMDFVENPLRVAGGSGSVDEWSVVGRLNPELVHEENTSVYGGTAYLETAPEDLQGAIVGTFSGSDLGGNSYYDDMQVGIEMTV
jgi:hypothetical protein